MFSGLLEVVGIVGDGQEQNETATAAIYSPYAIHAPLTAFLVIRTNAYPVIVVPEICDEITALDSGLPLLSSALCPALLSCSY
jgi:hypothetical protein